MKWISVKDQLPEAEGKEPFANQSASVLIYDEHGNRSIGYFNAEFRTWEDAYDYDIKVTHWMPLPEPPKEEKP